MVKVARILLWDATVGAVLWDEDRQSGTLEFAADFIRSGLDIAPITMPLADLRNGRTLFSFPRLSRETFKGLPGLLADSLPDRFGNNLINAWLASQGRAPDSANPVERLCYTGRRGMGALEFEPAHHPADLDTSTPLDIGELVKLAGEVLAKRKNVKASLKAKGPAGLAEIIRVGTSAGGARAKAVVAYNEKTGEVRSGQLQAPRGFSHWLMKFDGVTNEALGDPTGFGRIEYAYHRMAIASGITMGRCKLYEEGGRAHFMTLRFDRDRDDKIHMQTLCALSHFDYNDPNAYSYEQAFQAMRMLRLPHPDSEQLYRRMAFNVVAKNHDDHTKNISFLMDGKGKWSLSPAYDVTNANDPDNRWLNRHQMSVNGKRAGITRKDLEKVGREMNIKKWKEIVEEVVSGVSGWPIYAREAGIPASQLRALGRIHLLKL